MHDYNVTFDHPAGDFTETITVCAYNIRQARQLAQFHKRYGDFDGIPANRIKVTVKRIFDR